MGLIHDLIDAYHYIQDPNADKRQIFQQAMLANPQLLSQIQSNLGPGQNAQDVLKDQYGITNARWGANSNILDRLSQQAQNTPLDEATRTARLNSYINSPSQQTQQWALAGLTPGQQFNQIKQLYNNSNSTPVINNGFLETTPALNNTQQDILAKKRELPTTLETQAAQANIEHAKAASNAATEAGKESGARAANTQLDTQIKQQQLDARNTVDSFMQQHPEFKNANMLDLFNSQAVPANIKNSIIQSDVHGKRFDAEMTNYIEGQRTALEADRNKIAKGQLSLDQQQLADLNRRSATGTALQLWKDTGYVGGQSGYQGFLDAYNGQKTPEAQNVLNNANSATIRNFALQYNKSLSELTSNQGKLSGDAITAQISNLNGMSNILQSMGYNAPQLKFGAPQVSKTLGEKLTPNFAKGFTVQTVNGTEPAPVDVTKSSNNNTLNDEDAQADAIVNALRNGADFNKTMNDSRMSPTLREKVIKKYSNGSSR